MGETIALQPHTDQSVTWRPKQFFDPEPARTIKGRLTHVCPGRCGVYTTIDFLRMAWLSAAETEDSMGETIALQPRTEQYAT